MIEPLSPLIFTHELAPSEQNASQLMVAAGLSLSDKETTANFLFTYKERAKEKTTNRVNAVIALITICLTIGLDGFVAWQYKGKIAKEKSAQALRMEIDQKYQLEPRSHSDSYATQTMEKISQFHRENKEKVKRFKVVALINELAKKIGPEIKITDLVLDMAQKQNESRLKKSDPGQTPPPGQAPTPVIPGTLELSGYISAAPEAQDFILMNFLKTLATLNLLGEPKLKSNKKSSLHNQAILRFEITLKTNFAFLEPPAS